MIARLERRPLWQALRVVALIAGLLFLLAQVHFNGPMVRLDYAVRSWVAEHDFPVLGRVAELIVDLANPPMVVALVLMLGVVLTITRRSLRPVLLCVTAVVLLGTAVLSLKYAVARPGPMSEGGGVAWPSGHTTTSVVAFGVLSRLIGSRSRRSRWLLMVPPAVVGIGLVLRDYHWLSDVLAAWLLGPLLLLAATAVVDRVLGPSRRQLRGASELPADTPADRTPSRKVSS